MGQELLSAISGSFQFSDQILEDAEEGKAVMTAALAETFQNSTNDQTLTKERGAGAAQAVCLFDKLLIKEHFEGHHF